MPNISDSNTSDITTNQTGDAVSRETQLQQPNQTAQPAKPISKQLEVNRQLLEEVFKSCSDLSYWAWKFGPNMSRQALSVYFGTIVQKKKLNYMKSVLQDLVTHEVGPGTEVTTESIIQYFEDDVVSAESASLENDFDTLVDHILDGNLVIFFEGWDKAIVFQASGLETRQITEPISEPSVQGPRESTVENMNINIGLLRIRLKSPLFKLETLNSGGETRTKIAYCYLEGSVDPEMLAEFRERMEATKSMEVLETSYVEELIQDSMYSPFPQFRVTERPDVAVAALLDGKIVVLVQGTGTMLICPGLFIELLQSSEDYYQRTVYSSLIRWLRVLAFFMALTLPSIYIAVTTFHSEMIPTVLLLTILDSREGIPFPAFVEALIMEFFFELLREAGIRLPRPVGSAVSIVGALVIGEAAINAGLASPMMVIIVALTGIASFAIPQYNMAIALRILRFPLMALSASFGGFGLLFGLLVILWHMVTLRSLGQPFLGALQPFSPHQLLDTFIRAPIKYMDRSPRRKRASRSAPQHSE
ncbi:spore germination protein [Paenibacillus sp. ATY16]|uniref:spore germination protein n=1 Tax=Paenibacillus sp. ATY16 TaxID=1759312 RepID=UPI00200F449D|nr:spore germination protein [Paenibacillus sp. ATY16]MCK9859029.1 spore germination protein [Paenibacillus sp. ATY16]